MIKVRGGGFNDDGTVNLGIEFQIGRSIGNFNATVTEQEFIEAMNNNALIELGNKLILELNNEVAEVYQSTINQLSKELKNSNAKLNLLEMSKQQSNISIVMMLAELENKIPKTEIENENNIDN